MILAGTIVRFEDDWGHNVCFVKGGLYVVQRFCTDYQIIVNLENGGEMMISTDAFKIVLTP